MGSTPRRGVAWFSDLGVAAATARRSLQGERTFSPECGWLSLYRSMGSKPSIIKSPYIGP